jgi:protein TonB
MDAAIAETSPETSPAGRGADSAPPSSREPLTDTWDVRERDVPRKLRLAAGAFFPALGVALLIAFAPALPQVQKVQEEDAPIEALLVDAPEVPPPPEPEVPEPAAAAIAPAPGPRIQKVEAPKEVPTAAPEKDTPAPSTPEGASAATEGPAGGGGPPGSAGTGVAMAPPPPPPKPAAPPPRPAKPPPVPDDITPPKPVSMKSPAYPSAAKSAGIEGTVVISYTVGESGAVTDARVVKGPPELASACLEAVRGWRFTPAMSGGRPVSVKRSARFPFRLKT